MNSIFGADRGGGGFTLLELLISIAIFSVVISSVYGAYRVTFQTIHGAEKQALADATGRIILERISEDLAVIATDGEGMLEGKRGDGSTGRADSLTCIAFAHLDFSRLGKSGGRAKIAYSLKENGTGRYDLYRADTPIRPGEEGKGADDGQEGELVARDLLSFQLTYVTSDGTESDEWNSAPQGEAGDGKEQEIVLPALMKVEIVLARGADDEQGVYLRTSIALPMSREEKETEG